MLDIEQPDNYITIPQDTKVGYALDKVGEGVYTNKGPSKRGVVQKFMIPTFYILVTDIGMVDNDKD